MKKEEKPVKKRVQWEDVPSDGSLDSFAELNNLDARSISESSSSILILPSNQFLGSGENKQNLFANSAKEILIEFNGNRLEAALYDDGKERRDLVLKSADIIVPLLLFIKGASVTLGLSVLSKWIYDRWVKREGKQKAVVSVEYAELNPQGRLSRWKRIVGPVDEVSRLLAEEAKALEKIENECDVAVLNRAQHSNAENSVAENDESWWDGYRKEQAASSINEGAKQIVNADEVIKEKKLDVAENLYRQSLANIREALLWVPEEEDYSIYLHRVGSKIHDLFGCQIEFKDGSYWVACPVLLAHSKGGFSIGGSGKSLCSICGENMLDCPHIKGNVYNGVRAKRVDGICNICGQKNCAHQEGELHNCVRAFAHVVEINIDHISFVENPANPLSVVHRYSVPEADLVEMLPEDERSHFAYGKTIVFCHHCKICRQ